uniref:hypothetical protein n=1 Tax=Corydalis impatiens TaxID=2880154 RepID=UPI001EDEAAA6|nr:hypothetical protein MFU17_pgp025 [Corydalis impatiens]YP_010277418.1 hypothetical protein MFU17_pgp003 [Corydalis impatiens]UHY42546.1 hypothetical protein [Corydalis impatiens]UHY42565.1 hypothetical protein [Corydalis impatiens]
MTNRYWILFRIGPERGRTAGMPTDVYSRIHLTREYPFLEGTSSAKVTDWVRRQSNPLNGVLSRLRTGIFPEVFIVSIYPCVIPVEASTRGVGRTISKRHSLDREDLQDFVIRCRTYSNSNSSDSGRGDRRTTSYQQKLGLSIWIRSEISDYC